MDIQKAKVLITGGSQGIGLETARMLVARGAQVAICGRDAGKLRDAAVTTGAIPIAADVSKEDEVIRMVQQVIQQFDGFNVLVNNAGYGYFDQLQDLQVDAFRELLDTNLIGAALCARESAKHFIDRKYGNLINIASTAAKSGFAGGTAYCASKFALTALTECWRAELRKYNIRVMQVNPSEVQTHFVVNSGREARPFNPTKLQPEEIAHSIISMLEMNDRGFITDLTVFATNPQ
ncbi:MAG TPA: SDR family oxidoreductase [Saprospiraceae bacterium]|nr:SDR family oxidoreductase [Saprospiraceae bacterium]